MPLLLVPSFVEPPLRTSRFGRMGGLQSLKEAQDNVIRTSPIWASLLFYFIFSYFFEPRVHI
jgi:hypothetical protein